MSTEHMARFEKKDTKQHEIKEGHKKELKEKAKELKK